jgi:catechol 2,3-dioxygenase-like lactoylglutathione lyase family enzyme
MVQIGSVVLNVTDIGRAAAFWRGALGYVPRAGGHLGALVPRSGAGPALLLDETDRTHLDLHVGSEQEQQAEVERLLALGAQRVDWEYPEDVNFVVLSDTEGNLFCVVNTEGGQRP